MASYAEKVEQWQIRQEVNPHKATLADGLFYGRKLSHETLGKILDEGASGV